MTLRFGWFALFTMSNNVVHPFRLLETKLGTEDSVTLDFLISGLSPPSLSLRRDSLLTLGLAEPKLRKERRLVEPVGIEPTTSSLQS
jgi:hypothetical protein